MLVTVGNFTTNDLTEALRFHRQLKALAQARL
jgi:hypothetical protein